MPSVDVVIVSYNSETHLRSGVEALASVDEVGVVVVDSASTDRTLESIADLPVRTIALGHNRGFAHACNVGWRSGAAPFVLFLNPDAQIDAQSIDRLVGVANDDSSIGAVAPRIVNSDGSLDFSLRRFPRLRSTFAQALFLHRVFPSAAWTDELVRDETAYRTPRDCEWASGACLLVPRAVLERISGLDEDFFLYCEDLDLCRRIHALGLRVRFEPAALVRHVGGASAPRASLLPVLAASRIRYARKHRGDIAAVVERAGVGLGALTHALVSRGGRAARRGNLQALRVALLGESSARATVRS